MPTLQPQHTSRDEGAIGSLQSDPCDFAEPAATPFANAVIKAGMREPAILALQIIRPLSWVGAQLAWVAQPFVEGLGTARHIEVNRRRSPFSIAGIARFLEGEGNLEGLIATLENTPSHHRGDRGDRGDEPE